MRARTIWCVCGLYLAFATVDSQADPADPAANPRKAVGASAAATAIASTQLNAVDFIAGSGRCARNAGQTIGWEFDVLNTVTISSMTWFDDGGDGLDLAHEVGIFDPTGTLISTTDVIIPAGSWAMLDGIWRVVSIAPTTLPPGNSYIVGGFNGRHSECLSFNVTQTVHPDLDFVDATFGGTSFERPANRSRAVNGFYGVGFRIGFPASVLIVTAKTKCGQGGKDYIRIGGLAEGFSIEEDLAVSISGTPPIFGPVDVTIPADAFVIGEDGWAEATVPIDGGDLDVSLPESGMGSFQINVDAFALNQCPPDVDEADLTLTLGGATDSLTLLRESDSKFRGRADPDSDGDGYSDSAELLMGSDPEDAASMPVDGDGDGVPDANDNCPFLANPDQSASAQFSGVGCACLCGDPNRDCMINIGDVPEAQRAGMFPPLPPLSPSFDIDFCDINGDGVCNIGDSPEMLRAGLFPPLPPISPSFDVTACIGYLGP